jgi:hypothetical protein
MQRVQADLAWVYAKMQHLTALLLERGSLLSALERDGELIVHSSNQFVVMMVPWYFTFDKVTFNALTRVFRYKRAWHRLRTCCLRWRRYRQTPAVIDVSSGDEYLPAAPKKKLRDNGLVEL